MAPALLARARATYTRGVNERSGSTRDGALWRDLATLRRFAWLPAATIVIALIAALVIGELRPASGEARFRENVVVDALPPLFGPAVLPSPFDYARLATSDTVVQLVAGQQGLTPEQLRPRLKAEARLTGPEIDFTVTGSGALALARAWRLAFADAVAGQSGDLEHQLVKPYGDQVAAAQDLWQTRTSESKARPDDPVLKRELAVAEENYTTALKLEQSYMIVAQTMKATSFGVVSPHEQGAGVGSTAGRIGAALAIGLLVGVLGALALSAVSRRGSLESVAG
jgi:hypothetical protein